MNQSSSNAIPMINQSELSKKLVPLKHLVKLRKSCVQMILPDIRKCSNLVQNMVANRYSCFWGLGAIWQPLWLKNSHNMATFHHFLTFSVTFLVAMTSFMHKTCTERTETFLIHRTIDEVPFFAISRHLSRGPGVQKMAILWVNPGPKGRGGSRLDRPTWKVSGAPYHTPIHGRERHGAIFVISRHLSRG